MRLEFRLLGDIAVLADGHPLAFGGTRQRSVLALLVLQRDHPVATELLADRLWPDDQPLTAIKTIQVYVSRIRHALGPHADRLSSSATGYLLAVADDELDAARFERGLRRAREALARGSAEAALAGLEESLAQWSGPALGDLADEQFARREAERLEELRLQAFEELYELRIAAGAGRAAIGEVRRMVADQPGRERLWRLLMLALYADGRQGEALEAYQDARRYLADELGLDPSPELRDLERAILTQEMPRSERTAPVPPVLTPTGASEPVARRARRLVTVLHADVVGVSDDEQDPELLEALDRRILAVVRRAIERHGGTIDRADHRGVTAVFGLTVAREDDALRAVRAADELRAADVAFRVGVATGEVLTGSRDGSGSLLTGAPLGVAARLAARAAAGAVLLATDTAALVRGATMIESVPAGIDDKVTGPSAVRLVALTDGDPIVRRMTTAFVGRATELDELVAAFERVVSQGAPGLVTVIGAPGVGKSRLVAEAFTRIAERATILRSRCLPYGEGITYWPVRDLVFAAAAIGPGEPRAVSLAKLEAVAAGSDDAELVRDRVAAAIGLADEPAPAEEIRWAVRGFCEALAAKRPLVLLVDDLQWAEPALVELLGHILDLGRGSLLLLTIARPEVEEAHPDWLNRPALGLTRLPALDEIDAATLLDRLAPELPAGPQRTQILTAAEGNPLFVEQFVAFLADEPGGGRRGAAGQTAGGIVVPPTIAALLAARLDRLPDAECRLLERAAVIGRTFYGEALAELLAPDDRSELPRRLAGLARRDLVRPDRSGVPAQEAYRFRHLLIRDAAYARLPKDERAVLHEKFADWLEARAAVSPGEYELIVGYHLEQAYRYGIGLGDEPATVRTLADRALALIAPAGQAAEERGDPHAAVALLKRAVDLAPQGGPQRIELLFDLRNALRAAGERGASDATDAEAVALLGEYPDERIERMHRLRGLKSNPGVGRLKEARDGYAYFERLGDRLGMIWALNAAYHIHANRGEVEATMQVLDRATGLAIEIGRPGLAAEFAAKAAAELVNSPVPVPEALERCERYLELARNSRGHGALILMVIGELEARNGVSDIWRRRLDSAKTIIDDLGLVMPLGAAIHPFYVGVTELAAGEPSRAINLLRWSCSTIDSLGELGFLSSVAPLTAQTLLALGQLDEVEKYAFWGRDVAHREDLDAGVRWRMAISGLRSQQGRHDEAISLARESVSKLAKNEWAVSRSLAQMALADAHRAAGDEPRARAAAHEARRLASAKEDRAALRRIEAFLSN